MTDNEWDGLIHAVLFSLLFSNHPNVLRNSKKDPISIFLMLLNINPQDGNFASCSTICSRMLGLLHIFRLVAIREIHFGANQEVQEEESPMDVAQGAEFQWVSSFLFVYPSALMFS